MSLFQKKQKNKPGQKSWHRNAAGAHASIARKGEKKRRRKFSRFLFWPLLAGFLGICTYLLLFSPFLDIDAISVRGNQDIPAVDIAGQVEQSLGGKYFGIFSKKNFFMTSKKSVNEVLRNNFGRLKVESIEKKFPNTLIVKVTERKAELVWCSGGVCYFDEKNGLVYGGAAGTEEELRSGNFLVMVDDSAIPVEIGKTKIDPEYVGFIEAVSAVIRDDLKIVAADSFHTPGAASGEISVRTAEGWTLKVSSELSIEETKKTIETIFEKELNEEARKNLEYLDLRIKGKVYYKMKI